MNYTVRDTPYSRKVDYKGRVYIPKQLRDRFMIDNENLAKFKVIKGEDGSLLLGMEFFDINEDYEEDTILTL